MLTSRTQPDECTSSPTLRPNTRQLRNAKNGWSIHEAGMAQLDDDVGLGWKLKDMGADDNTIVTSPPTTYRELHLARWRQTPFIARVRA